MAKTRFRSDVSEAMYNAASGLHRVKIIDKKMMREYDDLCIEKAPEFNPRQERVASSPMSVSQPTERVRYLD
ncbi:hypothetical protein [Trinickia dinghuensis]|uniref:hypothetical protein n=1 Tax=Trinickia dinghuensis TaxID=2291023 RepID=UPI0015F187B5|nr:hypothetical protein [Trinickia dinghuensis]